MIGLVIFLLIILLIILYLYADAKKFNQKKELWLYGDEKSQGALDLKEEELCAEYIKNNPEEARNEVMNICSYIPDGLSDMEKWYLRILMSQKGKIISEDSKDGVKKPYMKNQNYDGFHRFMIWYNQELQKNGLKDRMYLRSIRDNEEYKKLYERSRYCYDIAEDAYKCVNSLPGYYFWASQDGVTQNKGGSH